MSKNLYAQTNEEFILFLRENESWLMERILLYAKEYAYVKYTSTLLEAWRISIVGLTDSLEMLMKLSSEIPQMSPDDTFSDDPASLFGIKEAALHRSRGVNLAMFFSLFKYYRQAYIDVVEKSDVYKSDYYLSYLNRFFDRVETAYVTEWAGRDSEGQIHTLSDSNRKLANEKNRYLTIFDSMNNPAIFLDTEGYIINYNLMAGELFFDDAHAGGYYYSNKNKLKIDLLFDIKNLENKDAFEWHYKDLIFNITSKSLHDISGKSEGLILLFNDITQLIKSEELIIIQSRQVAMGEMINMIAHQWRQPIAAISMGVNNILLDIGLESVDLEEFKLISEDILNQTQILSQIIDNFKNFFRPSKEKEQIKVEDVMLEAKNIIGKSLEDNEIKLSIHNENMKLIDTYSRELLQVFIVLLDNSKEALVEHRAHKRVIHVNISDNEDSVFIELCDNGGGIDKAIMDKIFEPYFSTKIEKNGTGLGLYIIKTIINKHMHGTIHAQNREEGVCFTVTLPLNSR